MNELLVLSFRHVMYSLRGGFLVRPTLRFMSVLLAGQVRSATPSDGVKPATVAVKST